MNDWMNEWMHECFNWIDLDFRQICQKSKSNAEYYFFLLFLETRPV